MTTGTIDIVQRTGSNLWASVTMSQKCTTLSPPHHPRPLLIAIRLTSTPLMILPVTRVSGCCYAVNMTASMQQKYMQLRDLPRGLIYNHLHNQPASRRKKQSKMLLSFEVETSKSAMSSNFWKISLALEHVENQRRRIGRKRRRIHKESSQFRSKHINGSLNHLYASFS
jgi:hypothetical protein